MKTLISIAVLLASAQALAQTPAGTTFVPMDAGGYGYWPHSSTLAEGVGHGVGDIMRSAGELSHLTSKAAINFQEAQRLQMDNAGRWLGTYADLRKHNTQLRAELRGPRPTKEDAVRLAQARMPRRLSPGELDPFTGRVYWPILLRTDQYAADRTALEKLIAARATRGAQSPEDYLRSRQLVAEMLEGLREQIQEVPPADFVAAKRFLDSLAVELVSPVRIAGSIGMMR